MTQFASVLLLGIMIISSSNNIFDEPQGCNCHCRIGFKKNDPVKEYPNPVIDIGIVESWGGIIGATNSRSAICKSRCYHAALEKLQHMPKAEFCSKSERFLSGQNRVPMNRLFTYYKVGGRNWMTCDSRFEKCE
ncbi:MAG TPA: hypothetical protein VK169_15090 [Saprospiraceae bacterium]|nr:hypothetical protein [Saprospiraceae bacterium]